jgi:hypothetical protein
MGALVAKAVFKNGKESVSTNYNSLFEIPAKTIDGLQLASLAEAVEGKRAVLVVNVATQ